MCKPQKKNHFYEHQYVPPFIVFVHATLPKNKILRFKGSFQYQRYQSWGDYSFFMEGIFVIFLFYQIINLINKLRH